LCKHTRRWRFGNAITASALKILKAERSARANPRYAAQAVYVATRDSYEVEQTAYDLQAQIDGPMRDPVWPRLGLDATSYGDRLRYEHSVSLGMYSIRMCVPRGGDCALSMVPTSTDPERSMQRVLIMLTAAAFGVATDDQVRELRLSVYPVDTSIQALRLLILMTSMDEAAHLTACARILWPGDEMGMQWDHVLAERHRLPERMMLARRKDDTIIKIYYFTGDRAWTTMDAGDAWAEVVRVEHAERRHACVRICAPPERELVHRLSLESWDGQLATDADGAPIIWDAPATARDYCACIITGAPAPRTW